MNYDVKTKAVTEWNVGCEKCHGPGSAHVAGPRARISSTRRASIRSARSTSASSATRRDARWSTRLRVAITTGRSDIRVGLKLKDFWQLEEYKPGETTFTHFADGTAHKNRMQGNDFVQSAMYTHGVTCCELPRRPRHAEQRRPDQVIAADVPDLSRTEITEWPAHRHDRTAHASSGRFGRERVHQLSHAADRADDRRRHGAQPHVQVHQPVDDRVVEGPESRAPSCHKDKTNAWATAALKSWPEFSPWRVGQ